MKPFGADELASIRNRALEQYEFMSESFSYREALKNLAIAADHLHAVIIRGRHGNCNKESDKQEQKD